VSPDRGTSEDGDGLQRLATALETAHGTALLRRAVESSSIAAAIGSIDTPTRESDNEDAWHDNAVAVAAGRSAAVGLQGAATTARARTAVHTIGRWLRASVLYRWLTADPEADGIVIDRSDSVTLSPLLGTLDRGFGWILPRAQYATVASLASRGITVTRHRPLRVGSLLLAVFGLVSLLVAIVRGSVSATVLAFAGGSAVLALLGGRSELTLPELRQHPVVAALRRGVSVLFPPPPEAQSRQHED
jgi:hypothetical protein